MAELESFTTAKLKKLPKEAKQYEKYKMAGASRGVGRLGIRVNTSGQKVFFFRYYKNKKPVFINIGIFQDPSRKSEVITDLTHAEDQARKYGAMLKAGIDPKDKITTEKEQEKEIALLKEARLLEEAKKGSIGELFDSYALSMKKAGKRTYPAVLSALKKEVLPFIPASTKAKEVTTAQLVDVLANMIDRGAATQSNRVRSYVMAAFNYGLKHDNDPAQKKRGISFGLQFNPVQAIPKQKDAERRGTNSLTIEEVKTTLEQFGHTPKVGFFMVKLLELCFFTGGQRPHELIASKWQSVNWEQKTLLITVDVSKTKVEHLIPLTDTAYTILQQLKAASGTGTFIFPKGQTPEATEHARTDSFAKAVTRYINYSNNRKFVPRDIRRTVKTVMGELGVSKHTRDKLQNHALQDVSSRHYDRYEYMKEKRAALVLWESKLTGKSADIIELKSYTY